MVAKEFIDSDRVNFLVWRYLLEGNYRETAAKFQKEWHVKAPHRDFAFACHVKSHALVSVINRGLVYSALEREHQRNRLPQDASAAAVEALQVGIFGPLECHPEAKMEEDEDAEGEEEIEMEPTRKRAPQQLSNGSPAKRPRLSNGYENGTDAAPTATPMEMDVDNQVDNHAYPSPLEGEPAPPPIVHTDGPEQGTQVDKVRELAPDTTFIRLLDDDHAHGHRPDTTPSPAPAGPDNAPIILQCEWNPRDPSILAAAGTDALARVWTISRATPLEPGPDHVSHHAHSLLDPDAPRDTTVTALSWTSDGAAIAVATDSRSRAAINVWSADGTHLQTMEVSEPPVIKLSWNLSNTALLAISPDKGGALVTVYYSPAGNSVSYLLPGHDIAATPLDAAWTTDTEFLLTGGDLFLCLHCDESSISPIKKIETKEDDSFTQVLYDSRSNLAATSNDKGILDLWDDFGKRKSISAHQGAITAMQWQPIPANQPVAGDERLIATGGDDCAILIWNALLPESKPKCFLTMDSPIVRLAFTPDGAFIAGATSNQVLIWKVSNHTVPRASWSRPTDLGWQSPKANAETEEEDEHCLCWDANGQKLVYGTNSRLAVINFGR
ncbi:WD40-repeat-containing domain protein [Thelonectria olida]|uniref:WD40-repeat-containing domain protein n=1 Tax=Thelonectria olida TaxID=1576542 RepID=A0A9P8WLX3_9HYPO|nr:WD40-repeat-containing domain protein [Thelonectria olida]